MAMQLLLVLLAAGAAAVPHVGHSDEGFKQYRAPEASVGAPYRFSYDSSAIGGPFHQEVGDALGSNRGIYGLYGQRVNYGADAGGFRASVQPNEPGVGNTKSATSLGSPSSASSGRQEDGDNGLIFPPPYPGGPGASGSGAPGYGTDDGSGTADDDGVRTTVESNEPGFNGAQNPADVDVYKMPGLVGIALVFSGPPGSAPAGAALIPPSGLGIEGRSLPVGPTGVGFLAPPRRAGPVYTNYGQQGGSGVYNFAYANGQVVGPRQQKYGDAAANKEGSYGVTVDDDRFRNVDYVTGTNGFSASGETTEPAVDGAQRPADVDITKSSESAGTAPMGESSGPDGSSLPTGSGGFQGVHGHVIPAAPLRPALTGQPGVLLVPGSAGYPTVQGRDFVPVGSAGPASPGLPAVSVVPGSYGFNFIHSYPSGTGAPGLNVPVSTTNVILPSPALSLVGGYSFGYTGGPGGVVHRETGDTSGTNSGVYGFIGEGGAVRNLNYAADGGEFRASVQRNQHGIDTSQNLAGGFVGALRGAVPISVPASKVPNAPFARRDVPRGGH
ncbi:uncharacterized protein LOC119173855 isoform X2 [Rhipicephalus microplus]|uniref:uncharacterized protein LOC119173855 isoform X2 n=1 Tax=Rhipicephalus microplus TaxID=6941 RepID=UPI003F6BDFB0